MIKELESEWLRNKAVKNMIFDEECWRWQSRGMENHANWMEMEYCAIESEEMQLQWEDGKVWITRRTDWLESKYGMKKKYENKLFHENGCVVTDEEIIE